MLLTIKCDTLELVWAESKDKEISGKLPNCIKVYLISKAKYPAVARTEVQLSSCNLILVESLQSFKEIKFFFFFFLINVFIKGW